jgi:hypothetical protein
VKGLGSFRNTAEDAIMQKKNYLRKIKLKNKEGEIEDFKCHHTIN